MGYVVTFLKYFTTIAYIQYQKKIIEKIK